MTENLKKIVVGEAIRIGFQRNKTADATVHVLHAAFLPRAVRVAEIGLNAKRIELMVKEKSFGGLLSMP
jgi:hypothetical protein